MVLLQKEGGRSRGKERMKRRKTLRVLPLPPLPSLPSSLHFALTRRLHEAVQHVTSTVHPRNTSSTASSSSMVQNKVSHTRISEPKGIIYA
eukprot:2188860-Rhodomonas_salina.1